MKKIILVHNFNDKDFSIHKVSEFLYVTMKTQKIDDLVLFVPSMGKATEDFVMGLFNISNMCDPDFHAYIVLDEDDYSNISFDFFERLYERNPNFHLRSKDDGVYIGEHYFKWLDLHETYTLDEFPFYRRDIVSDEKWNYVVPTKKEEVFLKNVSKKFNCIVAGETQVLLRKRSRDFMYRKFSIEKDNFSNSFSCDYLFTDNNDLKIDKKDEITGPVLKLSPRNKNKNGN